MVSWPRAREETRQGPPRVWPRPETAAAGGSRGVLCGCGHGWRRVGTAAAASQQAAPRRQWHVAWPAMAAPCTPMEPPAAAVFPRSRLWPHPHSSSTVSVCEAVAAVQPAPLYLLAALRLWSMGWSAGRQLGRRARKSKSAAAVGDGWGRRPPPARQCNGSLGVRRGQLAVAACEQGSLPCFGTWRGRLAASKGFTAVAVVEEEETEPAAGAEQGQGKVAEGVATVVQGGTARVRLPWVDPVGAAVAAWRWSASAA